VTSAKFLLALLAVGLTAGVGVAQPYVEDSIDVGRAWVGSMCYNSVANVVYGRSQDDVFFAISADSKKVVARWTLSWPRQMCYDSIDNKCYVAHSGEYEDSLAVIDGTTHSYLRGTEMPDATMPIWDQVSNRVFVTSQTRNEVVVVDCGTDSVIARVPVGDCPLKLSLNARHRKLYVLNSDGESVSIVDIIGNRVLRTLALGSVPNAGGYSINADKFYVGASDQVVVIGGQTDTVVARISIPLGSIVWSIAANPRRGLVYLGIDDGVGLSMVYTVVDAADTILYELAILRGPEALFYSAVSGYLYCANYDGFVTAIAGDGSGVVRTLTVDHFPFALAYSPTSARLFVGHLNSRWVFVIRDTGSALAEQRLPAPGPAQSLQVWPSPFASSVLVRCPNGVGHVAPLHVYAQSGATVRTLAGRDAWHWDGRDDHGRPVPAGAYVLRIAGSAGSTVLVKVK